MPIPIILIKSTGRPVPPREAWRDGRAARRSRRQYTAGHGGVPRLSAGDQEMLGTLRVYRWMTASGRMPPVGVGESATPWIPPLFGGTWTAGNASGAPQGRAIGVPEGQNSRPRHSEGVWEAESGIGGAFGRVEGKLSGRPETLGGDFTFKYNDAGW